MNEQIGVRNAGGEGVRHERALAVRAAIDVRGSGEIGAADLRAFVLAAEHGLDARPIRAGGIAEYAGWRVSVAAIGAVGGSERVFLVLLRALGHRPHRGRDQRDLRREQVAEQAGYPPGYVDAWTSEARGRKNFDAGDPAGRVIPDRPAAHEVEALRDFLAAGAQRRAAPQIDDERARHLAVLLQVAADHLVGRKPPEIHRGLGGQGARIDA